MTQATFSDQVHVGHGYYIAFGNQIFVGYDYFLDQVYYFDKVSSDLVQIPLSRVTMQPSYEHDYLII